MRPSAWPLTFWTLARRLTLRWGTFTPILFLIFELGTRMWQWQTDGDIRVRDTATYSLLKVSNFFYSLSSNLTHSIRWLFSHYWKFFADPGTRVFHVADSEDSVILCVVLTQDQRVTDKDTFAKAKTGGLHSKQCWRHVNVKLLKVTFHRQNLRWTRKLTSVKDPRTGAKPN